MPDSSVSDQGRPMSNERFERWAKEIGLTDAQWMPVRVVLDREYERGAKEREPSDA